MQPNISSRTDPLEKHHGPSSHERRRPGECENERSSQVPSSHFSFSIYILDSLPQDATPLSPHTSSVCPQAHQSCKSREPDGLFPEHCVRIKLHASGSTPRFSDNITSFRTASNSDIRALGPLHYQHGKRKGGEEE